RKKIQLAFDTIQSKINAASKEIGNLMKQGKKEEAEQLKQEVFSLKENLAEINGKLIFIEIELQDKLVLLPNLPAEIVPHGKSAE
ncbi:hypothetical protein ABTE34_20880, partial [Acinetobacter baumannii]